VAIIFIIIELELEIIEKINFLISSFFFFIAPPVGNILLFCFQAGGAYKALELFV